MHIETITCPDESVAAEVAKLLVDLAVRYGDQNRRSGMSLSITHQEIADMTHVSLGTVKSRIHRGRLALRDVLGDDVELLRE